MYSIGNYHDWKASNEHNTGDADANRIQMVQFCNGRSLCCSIEGRSALYNCYIIKSYLLQIRLGRRKSLSAVKRDEQRWLRDLKLVEWGPRSLFCEYLEMGEDTSTNWARTGELDIYFTFVVE